MTNLPLQVLNAGHGETPPCPDAKFARGDVVRTPRSVRFAGWPERLAVLVAVPPGFSPSYALADLLGRPRPLMCQVEARHITYICCDFEGQDRTPYLVRERDLRATGDQVEIGAVSEEAPAGGQGAGR